jgi:hypothetical protein
MAYIPMQMLHLPYSDFLALEFHLIDTRPGVKPAEFITGLVQRWLKLDQERLALRKNGQPLRGFQWKNVFLPDGTNLRTSYRNAVDFAKVVGDRIVAADGASLTPSLFANTQAKGRNAWRFVWLRFPGEDHWVLADQCRQRTGDNWPSVRAARPQRNWAAHEGLSA